MDRPTDATLPTFIKELKKRKVKDVVRVCEPTYKTDLLAKENVEVHEMQFSDGSPPPQEIVAGLGRAPVLVALALMELGMEYEDTVDQIRMQRRGAINSKQLEYLSSYRPKSRLKLKSGQNKCIIA